MRVLVEGCVTTVEEAVRCAAAGAGRLELCSNLEVGGLTPSPDLVAAVRGAVALPVFAMVRPRAGNFVYDPSEVDRMVSDIGVVRSAGAQGIVTGVLTRDARVDAAAVRRIVRAAAPLTVTFHRAFDQVTDPVAALGQLLDIGIARLLTAGGTGTALDGADTLADLVRRAEGRLSVMPGGRVRADTVVALLRRTGALEVHARAEGVADLVRILSAR